MMKQLTEIDCNEELWAAITGQLRGGWANLENEVRFAYCTQDKDVTEDEIESWLSEVFPTHDQIEVDEFEQDNLREYTVVGDWRYFGASVIIYRTMD